MEESRKSAVWEGILEFWSLEEVPSQGEGWPISPSFPIPAKYRTGKKTVRARKILPGFLLSPVFLVQGASQVIADAVPTHTLLPLRHHTP